MRFGRFFTSLPVDLFRSGNSAGPRLDKLRKNKDIVVTEQTFPSGQTKLMVAPGGGVSLWDGKNPAFDKPKWWILKKGLELPDTINLHKGHTDPETGLTHYMLTPTKLMPLDEFSEGLRKVSESAVRDPSIINSDESNVDKNKACF